MAECSKAISREGRPLPDLDLIGPLSGSSGSANRGALFKNIAPVSPTNKTRALIFRTPFDQAEKLELLFHFRPSRSNGCHDDDLYFSGRPPQCSAFSPIFLQEDLRQQWLQDCLQGRQLAPRQ